ncbi:site-specific integrase [Leuconostoc falkenbergense]|uniref:tyrosine-type recombinase/integrase n=1 Tax=Leuconostoc falkenbergense TaxID=2766470 RepID=UPI0021AA1EA5|nr:site-specific integrase [Leuconostoc falkenbergense]MCT4420523.1 site-specific integrase [Leuconostoc falkenbergense]
MQIKQVDSKQGKVFEVVGYIGRHEDGTQARAKKRGFESKRSATQWFNNEVALFKNGQSKYNKKTTPNVMTVKELYDMWLKTYEQSVEESTLNKTMTIFKLHVLPQWADILVTDIKPIDLQLYINTLQREMLMYRKVTGYFRRLLDIAVKMDILDNNPFIKVELPKERKVFDKPKQFMEADEFKKFVDVLDNKYKSINQQAYTLLRLAAFTGMRTEEILALQWQHVDFNKGYISIVQALGRGLNGGTYLKEPKSRTSKRTLKIDNSMVLALSEWYNSTNYKDDTNFVFTNEGKTLQPLRPNKWLHDVSDKYGVAVGLSMHKLRHTWATLAIDQGASVKQVQTYLGHADASITLNIYTDITKRASDETGNILNGLIS